MKFSKYKIMADKLYGLKVKAHAADLLERAAITAGAEPWMSWTDKFKVLARFVELNAPGKRAKGE